VHELAKLRDLRERRVPGDTPLPTYTGDMIDTDPGARILVADTADPTLTFWTRITGNLAASRAHIAQLTGISADIEPLIVDTHGYGDYGRHREVFGLPVLCAIEQLAAQDALPAAAIGDWLHVEGGSTGDPTAEQVLAAFTDAFAGIYDTRRAFTIAERDRNHWTDALAVAGIPPRYFNLDAFAHDLFTKSVHEVRLDNGRIAIFHRS
jgi:hypothetical protein